LPVFTGSAKKKLEKEKNYQQKLNEIAATAAVAYFIQREGTRENGSYI
jgi:hypothetical protein